MTQAITLLIYISGVILSILSLRQVSGFYLKIDHRHLHLHCSNSLSRSSFNTYIVRNRTPLLNLNRYNKDVHKKVGVTICRKNLTNSCSISNNRGFKNLAVVKLKLLKVNMKSHHLLYTLILYFLNFEYTRVGTLIVAPIYLQLIQNRYMF